MRTAEDPRAADELYQRACTAGLEAAEATLERHVIITGEKTGSFDLEELVASVVSAVLEDAGSRLPALLAAPDRPFVTGLAGAAYANAVSDCGHLLGACPAHRPDVLALRHARRN
jgi:hypothetical protein